MNNLSEILSHFFDLALLIASAFLGNFLAKLVKKHYLIKHNYNKKSVAVALLFPLAVLSMLFAMVLGNQVGILIMIDIAVIYCFYLYSSFAHSPQEFQNQDILKIFKR